MLLTQQGCLHSGPQLQLFVVNDDGLAWIFNSQVSWPTGKADIISWKSLGVSERGVGVGDAWTRVEAKNSRLVESPSDVHEEAGEMGRSRSSDILLSIDF